MSIGVLEATQVVEAVFSVCLPAELLGGVMTAVESVSGTYFAGEFQEYITSGKKPHFPSALKNAPVCVALIDCDINRQAALETMENLQHLLPIKSRLIAVSENPDSAFLVQAIRAGCNEILGKPLAPDELASALRRFQLGSSTAGAVNAMQTGKAIAMIGSKGGVGTTTLAVHLAMHLVRTHGKRVLLVDQKHQLGHLALYLGIKQPKYYFSELLRNADRLDAPLLDGLITRHSIGLDVIASPQVCTPRYETSAEIATSVVSFLRQRYDFVLLDLQMECSGWLDTLFSCCDEVVMVCTPEVASLRDATRYIEYLSLTEGFSSKLCVVVNRAGSEAAISKGDIERATHFPVSVEVPNNYMELVKAVNAGEPMSVTSKGKYARALSKWARTLVTDSESEFRQIPAKKRSRLWQ
jgi:pilus assembly protein CpaE